jgi:penicillin-binding protein 2
VAVFVENGQHGSSVAGPVAKAVVDAYLLDILQLDFSSQGSGDAPSAVSEAAPARSPQLSASLPAEFANSFAHDFSHDGHSHD